MHSSQRSKALRIAVFDQCIAKRTQFAVRRSVHKDEAPSLRVQPFTHNSDQGLTFDLSKGLGRPQPA